MKISWSRIQKYRTCPKQYEYSYVENLEGQPNEHLILGSMFHRMIDAYYTGQESIEDIQSEYEGAIASNLVTSSPTLLKNALTSYVQYYAKEIEQENIVASEQSIIADWDNDDEIEIIADKIVERDGLTILRDHKTTTGNLKYTDALVKYNPQLLLYVSVVEDQTNTLIDAVEIDEIRLAELEQPRINKNGKPTADTRALSLVTYEAYYNTLASMGLEEEPEYQTALAYLEKRGHPLFKRVLVQVERELVKTNLDDVFATYKHLNADYYPRNIGRLCDWCEFKDLCRLDFYNPTEEEREIVMQRNKIGTKQERTNKK
jgi:hypothetical protein